MSLFGTYWMHCAVCAKGVQVHNTGVSLWGGPRSPSRTCSEECFKELELREARSICGLDTPAGGTDKWRAGST